uniref:Uncharacterized protein n=1 Tax=Zea mays TaxID=4577 RepID=A0A804Q1D8_MAIZE
MIPKIKRHPNLYLACELNLLLVRIIGVAHKAVPPRLHRLAEVVVPRHCRFEGQDNAAEDLVAAGRDAVLDGDKERLVEGLRRDEHELLVPDRVGRPRRRAGARAAHLAGELQLDAGGHRARGVVWDEVLRGDGGDAEVHELGREVYLGARGRDGGGARGGVRVGVPGVRERLVGLGAEPDGEHDLPVGQLLPALGLEAVPLRRERRVRGHADGHLREVERDAADEVVAGEVLGLEGDLEQVGLEVRGGEGEDLLPGRAVAGRPDGRGALEVAELDLDEGVDGARGGHRGQVARLDDVHVEEPHRLDEVVGGGDLARARGRGGGGRRGVEARDVEARPQHGGQRGASLHQPELLLRGRHRAPRARHHERPRRRCSLHLVGGARGLLSGERRRGGAVGPAALLLVSRVVTSEAFHRAVSVVNGAERGYCCPCRRNVFAWSGVDAAHVAVGGAP